MAKPPSIRRVNVESVFRPPALSHGVIAGDFVYISGVLGTVGDTLQLADGGVAGQTTRALRNVEEILRACGACLEDLVKVNVYLTDVNAFFDMDGAYAEVVRCRPARVTVSGCQLPLGAVVEIDAVAYRPGIGTGE